jgi:hypothetical protein
MEMQFRRLRLYQKKLARSSNPADSLELEVIERLLGEAGSKGDYLRFKRSYYMYLSEDRKQKVKSVLLRILRSDVDWPVILPVHAAHVSADIEFDEAKDDIRKMAANSKYQLHRATLERVLLFFDLDISIQFKFIFTEPYHSKPPEEYDEFMKRYYTLPPEEQAHVREALLRLMYGSDIPLASRGVQVYHKIDPKQAKREIERMKADPRWKDFIEFLPRAIDDKL